MQGVIGGKVLFAPEVEAHPTHYDDAATGREFVEHSVQVQGVIGEEFSFVPECEAYPMHYGDAATGRESVEQAA